MPKKIVLS